jgi:hypothetical protein
VKLALNTKRQNSRAVAIWSHALPFVENKRGVLIHRPTSVHLYNLNKHAHISVHYYCGNCSSGTKNFTFIECPPEGALLCARCEAAAIAAGMPSTFAICGRHVHEGRVVAVQTCCEAQEPPDAR